MERDIIFHELLLFACHCQGDILGMLSVHRRGDESLQSFLVTIKIQSVIPVSARLVLYLKYFRSYALTKDTFGWWWLLKLLIK